jgi:hypothetical protein
VDRPSVVELDATNSQLAELHSGDGKFEVLRLGGSRMTSLPAAPELRVLDISHLDLADLAVLTGQRKLKELVMVLSRVTDLLPLTRASLELVDVRWSRVASLAPLTTHRWTLRKLLLDADKLPLVGALTDMTITHLTIEGKREPISLAHISPLRTLEELLLVDVVVDRHEVDELRAHRPRLAILGA